MSAGKTFLALTAIAAIAAGVAVWKWDDWVTIPELRGGLVRSLKDPQSAQFRSERLGKNSGYLCGELNAKNEMGGYVGFRRFIATSRGSAVEGENLKSWPDAEQDMPQEKLIERVRARVEAKKMFNHEASFEQMLEWSEQQFFGDIWQKYCQ